MSNVSAAASSGINVQATVVKAPKELIYSPKILEASSELRFFGLTHAVVYVSTGEIRAAFTCEKDAQEFAVLKNA